MLIYVSRPTGLPLSIDVEPADTINNIKSKVFALDTAYPADQQILTFNGLVITDDTKTVTDYGIRKFSTVYLTLQNQVSCFLASAPVLTPSGYVVIASLREGDLVITGDGRPVAIQRVKKMRVNPGPSVNPYVVPKGRFGAIKELLISPNHKIHTGSEVTEAKHLGLEQEKMSGPFDYYNLELPAWPSDTMVVAGVTVESMAPIRRITISMAEFKAMLRSHTPTLQAKINASVRFLPDGVSVPVVRR